MITSRSTLICAWFLCSGCPVAVQATVDGGSPVDCSHIVRAPESSVQAARQVDEFLTVIPSACPAPDCDTSVALPWCGPFVETDGGRALLSLQTSADRTVVKVSAWKAELFFAAPSVAAPEQAVLVRAIARVNVPKHIGPFLATADGLAMRSPGGTPTVPTRCLATPAPTRESIEVGRDWRFYWRPVGASEWVYCGPVGD